MAPEVMNCAGHEYSADIWSLGITALELALGNAPYSNLPAPKVMINILNSEPPKLPEDGKWDPKFSSLIKSCLQK